MVSVTLRPLYLQGNGPWYPLDRRLGGPQSRSGRGGEEKNSSELCSRRHTPRWKRVEILQAFISSTELTNAEMNGRNVMKDGMNRTAKRIWFMTHEVSKCRQGKRHMNCPNERGRDRWNGRGRRQICTKF